MPPREGFFFPNGTPVPTDAPLTGEGVYVYDSGNEYKGWFLEGLFDALGSPGWCIFFSRMNCVGGTSPHDRNAIQ